MMNWALVFVLLLAESYATRTSYTAAVFEHARFGNRSNRPEEVVTTNLRFYNRAAALAKDKGADILVFPEYGVFPADDDRDVMKAFAEEVPDPVGSYPCPCDEPGVYADRPILFNLSCIAKANSMFVVGNMADIQRCGGARDEGCPDDGVFLFNTNVVFDRAGRLLLKYHKENLFLELSMNPATSPQFPVFETDFGRFATFICFDIQFPRMGQVSKEYKVDGVAYPTMWDEEPPQMTSLQVFESWAVEHNLTLLAADVNSPGFGGVGSGIFDGSLGALVYTYNPDGLSKLLVARIPKRGHSVDSREISMTAVDANGSYTFETDGRNVKRECAESLLGKSKDDYKDFRCFEENTSQYTFVRLNASSGAVKSCNNLLCCTLDYVSEGLHDTFYLASFSGIQSANGSKPWCEELCVLTVCESTDDGVCARFPRRSSTKFRSIQIKGTLKSQDVYPSIVESGMRLVPKKEWSHRHCRQSGVEGECFTFHKEAGRKVIAAGLKGRCYDRDPQRNTGKSTQCLGKH